ncbi:uncharacterized protein LOC100915745 [Sarcophilus harrisii]|nr:uncharacterized protein LOC100915745 [Sarcophilus harrisii]
MSVRGWAKLGNLQWVPPLPERARDEWLLLVSNQRPVIGFKSRPLGGRELLAVTCSFRRCFCFPGVFLGASAFRRRSSSGLCAAVSMAHKQIYYSDKYFDEHYEYRHVMLPRELSKQVPKTHLMSEEEWRRLGVQQSLGWVHYMIHEPEPHILLFRRPLPKEQQK